MSRLICEKLTGALLVAQTHWCLSNQLETLTTRIERGAILLVVAENAGDKYQDSYNVIVYYNGVRLMSHKDNILSWAKIII